MDTRIFNQFLGSEGLHLSLVTFVTNLLLAVLLGVVLEWLYVRHGKVGTNRRAFGSLFPLIAMTTMLIISVVKSSIALSLGLVGALSIVRFRTAIKDPEELAYIFISIAVGLGFGANQVGVTLLGFFCITLFLYIRSISGNSIASQGIHLLVVAESGSEFNLKSISNIVEQVVSRATLQRYESSNGLLELLMCIEVDTVDAISSLEQALGQQKGIVKLSIVDSPL